MRSAVIALFVFTTAFLQAQSLDFIGMPGISFGMPLKDLKDAQLIMDSSSAYSDTALYLKTTRCQMYYSKSENLQLKGFTAARIEYQFCDSVLSYVFIYVNGKDNINNAVSTLKITFPKMGCGKKTDPATCPQIDSHNRRMRLIIKNDLPKNEMRLVLIPKKAAG